MLADQQRQTDRVTVERDVLQLEKKQLDGLLEEARRELEQIRLRAPSDVSPVELTLSEPRMAITSAAAVLTPPSYTGMPRSHTTGKRKLPQIPGVQVPPGSDIKWGVTTQVI